MCGTRGTALRGLQQTQAVSQEVRSAQQGPLRWGMLALRSGRRRCTQDPKARMRICGVLKWQGCCDARGRAGSGARGLRTPQTRGSRAPGRVRRPDPATASARTRAPSRRAAVVAKTVPPLHTHTAQNLLSVSALFVFYKKCEFMNCVLETSGKKGGDANHRRHAGKKRSFRQGDGIKKTKQKDKKNTLFHWMERKTSHHSPTCEKHMLIKIT